MMKRLIKLNESFPIEQIWPSLVKKSRFVLLETQRTDHTNHLSYLFAEPVSLINCSRLDKIPQAFAQLEAFLDSGYWAAGFFSYEAGYAWEHYKGKTDFNFPLIWLGIFKPPLIFDHFNPDRVNKINEFGKYQIKNIRLSQAQNRYTQNIHRIKEYIAQGLTYQVNCTFKCKFGFKGSDFALYNNLRRQQTVAYASFIRDKRFSLVSSSPELFFRKEGSSITVRPMKGTISRGRTCEEDLVQARRLKASAKDRSENLMIVDLLRNDLGRISEIGSVKVPKLYEIEKYETLFQMTSTIKSRLKPGVSFHELFRSLFPSGSVTGAPKIKTMDIIKGMEQEERKAYTGAIGFIQPNRDAVFNVAIRTILLSGTRGEMGIGSGIVYDSDAGKEYAECKLKASFFTDTRQDLELIETIRWSKRGGLFLISYHLERLALSAKYFNFVFDRKDVVNKLRQLTKRFNPDYSYKIRLLLSAYGKVTLSYARITKTARLSIPRVTFADNKTNSKEVSLYHKTTNRQLYDRQLRAARKKGFFDIIFENENSEATEGAISNVFIRKGSRYYTPPLNCGLLNGVYRRYFIERNRHLVKQAILKRKDLYQADAVYLSNSVRGLIRVKLY